MKKFFAMLLALTMALSLAACGGDDAAEVPADETPDAPAEDVIETVTPGKLTLATCPDMAPFGFYAIGEDGTAQLAGYDYAVAEYIADYLGLELEIIPMDFDGILTEITAGSVDMGMACLSPTPERAEVMNFSEFYYEMVSEDQKGQIVFTAQENQDKWSSLEELNDPSVTVGVQLASLQAELAQANTPDADIVQLGKVTDIISEVLGGKLDAGYAEAMAIESYQTNYPELYIAFDVPSAAPKGSSIGMNLDNDALLAGVNEAIAAAKAEGLLETFMAEAQELANGNIYEGLMD